MEAVIADQKLTSLSAFTPVKTDLLYGVDDPGGSPASGKFTIEALLDVLKAPYTKTNEGLISFTQTLTGSDASVALYLQGDYNTSGAPSLVALAIDDTASAATTPFIICERLDGGTVTYWSLLKSGQMQMRNGSAASPILTFLSDPDTGLFRAGANTLGFAVGGTETVDIGANGASRVVSGTSYLYRSVYDCKAGSQQIADGNSTAAVTFGNAAQDATYAAVMTPAGDPGSDTYWIDGRTVNGFTMNRSGTTGNLTFHWVVIENTN